VITDDDNTAPGVVDFASATDISHTTAYDVSATAPELEVAELDRVGATMDELTSTPAHVAEPCATSTGRHPVAAVCGKTPRLMTTPGEVRVPAVTRTK